MMINFREYVYYDETSPSCLRWNSEYVASNRHIHNIKANDVAGWQHLGKYKYWSIKINSKVYQVSHVVWCLFNKYDGDTLEITYIDRCCSNTKISNLRLGESGKRTAGVRNQRKRINNTSGTTGVCLIDKKFNKHGRNDTYQYWVATWRENKGLVNKSCKKCFGVYTYGYDEAKKLAIQYRSEKLKELNMQGACYTELHGK